MLDCQLEGEEFKSRPGQKFVLRFDSTWTPVELCNEQLNDYIAFTLGQWEVQTTRVKVGHPPPFARSKKRVAKTSFP